MIDKKLTLDLIKEFKEYIASNDFIGFYRNLYDLRHGRFDKIELTLHDKDWWKMADLTGNNIGAVTDVFYEAGVLPDILNNLNDIPPLMFMGSEQINEIRIPSNIKTIGHEAFEYSDFQKITFEEGCFEIGSEAFYGCHAKEIILPNSLESIAVKAFFFCNSLTEITIPPNVTSFGDRIFTRADSSPTLKINFPKSVEETFSPDEIKKMVGGGKVNINFY